MAFRYRFQRLLRLKEQFRKQAQAELAEALSRLRRIENRLLTTRESLKKARETFLRKQVEGIRAGEYLTVQDHIRGLEQQLLVLESEWQQARSLVEERRRILLEKEKEVKQLERLYEIEHERFRRRQKKIEQKRLDEAALPTGSLPRGHEKFTTESAPE